MDMVRKMINTINNNLIKAIVGLNEVIKLSENNFKDIDKDKNTVIISISYPDNEFNLPTTILNQFKDSLTVSFWDILETENDKEIISLDIAKKIRNFIEKNKSNNFLIHCDAGKSRSSAVGLAVYLICMYEDDKYLFSTSPNEITSNSRYSPNRTVFDMIANCN